jgi:hypothetical protein
MRNKSRQLNHNRFQVLYDKLPLYNPDDKYKCYYCGSSAFGEGDHQPPLSVIENFLSSSIEFECYIIPCCIHCNSILGTSETKTVQERFQLLKSKYRKKYKHIIKINELWTHEELKEMGQSLRSHIEKSLEFADDVFSTLAYPGHLLKSNDLKNKGQENRREELKNTINEPEIEEIAKFLHDVRIAKDKSTIYTNKKILDALLLEGTIKKIGNEYICLRKYIKLKK